MAFKSIEHTVDVHYQGVIRTIQQYKIPADARYSILMDLINESNQSSVFLELDDLLLRIKQSNNLSEYFSGNRRKIKSGAILQYCFNQNIAFPAHSSYDNVYNGRFVFKTTSLII